jgi:hypothetical protein
VTWIAGSASLAERITVAGHVNVVDLVSARRIRMPELAA